MTTLINEKQVLTVQEAARTLNVHPATVRRAIRAGQIKAFKLSPTGGRYKIHIDELKKLFDKPIDKETEIEL